MTPWKFLLYTLSALLWCGIIYFGFGYCQKVWHEYLTPQLVRDCGKIVSRTPIPDTGDALVPAQWTIETSGCRFKASDSFKDCHEPILIYKTFYEYADICGEKIPANEGR